MKLLSLDQASRVSGYAVFDGNNLITYGKIDLSEAEDIGFRLVELRRRILDLIKEYNIEVVAFEDIQMQSSVTTFKVLANVYGTILELVSELKIPYYIVPSVSWKSTLQIKGRQRPEQKKNAQNYVVEHYNIRPTQDECDAICIGTHIIKTELGSAWTN